MQWGRLGMTVFMLYLCLGGGAVVHSMEDQAVTTRTQDQARNTKPQKRVLLVISGAIRQGKDASPMPFDLTMLQQLPQQHLATHTLVTDGLKQFKGVLVRDVLNQAGVSETATMVQATALNDYQVRIPITDFYDYEVLLATHMDGEELHPSEKGPLWIVYPRDQHRKLQDIRYDYRWVWQLKSLHIY